MTSGIYAIRHVASDRAYIGQSQNIEKRWNNHRTTLNRGCSHNVYLQRCWNKYGAEAFVFEVLEEEDELSKLAALERWHMLSIDKDLRLNLAEDTEVAFRGRHHTEENKRLMGERARLRRASPETKAKMSEAQKRRHTDWSVREKRSNDLRAHYAKPGTREAHGQSQKKWAGTPEARRKNGEAQKKSYQENPERANAVSAWMTKRFSSEEARIAASRQKGGRPVVGTNLETGEERRYEYLEAIKRDGFQPANAKRVISGQYRQHKGHKWRYEVVQEEL